MKIKFENVELFNAKVNPGKDDKVHGNFQFLDYEDRKTLDYYTSDEYAISLISQFEGSNAKLDLTIELNQSKFGLQLGQLIEISEHGTI